VTGLLDPIAKDWKQVAGSLIQMTDSNSINHLSALRPEPQGSDERKVYEKMLCRLLGLTPQQVLEYTEPVAESTASDSDDSDLGDESSDDEDQVSQIRKPIIYADASTLDRCQLYGRVIALGRPLLSIQSLILGKRIYSKMNTIICHVSIRSYTLLILGNYVDQGLCY
jgi:hypothetical protein